MTQPELSPIQRLVLALWALFAILFRAEVAAAVSRVRDASRSGLPLPPAPEPPAARPAAPVPPPAATTPARPAEPVPPPASSPAPAPGASQGSSKPAAGSKPAPAQGVAAAPPVAAPPPAAPPAAAPPAPVIAAPVPSPMTPAPATAPAPAKTPEPPRAPDNRAALQLLGLLQREGRLVDFVEEDLAGFPDSAIGAAARTVHAGCKKVIDDLFRLEAVYREGEGAKVTVAAGFDAATVRLTGNVVGKPPFQGALRHHGWRAREVRLPPAPDGQDLAIVAPAEVEL